MADRTDRAGLVHLYHGPGKGKTTAAMGLTVRAVGHGMTVSVLQFMKGAAEMREQYGEVKQFRELEGVSVEQFPASHARGEDDLSPEERETLASALERAEALVAAGETDVVVLDELLTLYTLDFADEERLVDIVRAKAESVEVLITGREAPPAIVDEAEYVSYVGEVKHPFRQGAGPRLGIEY
ncbi:MAG: cob(I)yrinic acid a,c-diamide adenosyltransferase [Haloglomus sp.]